jgi:hypothetical protein
MTNNKTEVTPKRLSLKSINTEMQESNAEVDDRLTSVEQTIGELAIDMKTSFTEILKAINNPVSISKDGKHCEDVYAREDIRDVKFADVEPEEDAHLIEQSLTSVHSPEFKVKADQMKFDNEKIQIMVMSSMSQYPDHVFSVGVNGITLAILRGKKQWVPRTYVETILRAKTSTYGNIEVTDPNTSERQIKWPETRSFRYPLQIIKDNNPAGAHWLERVINDRAA